MMNFLACCQYVVDDSEFVQCVVFLFLQKKLHYFTLQSEQLKSEITSRNDLLSRIDSETHTVEEVSWLLNAL